MSRAPVFFKQRCLAILAPTDHLRDLRIAWHAGRWLVVIQYHFPFRAANNCSLNGVCLFSFFLLVLAKALFIDSWGLMLKLCKHFDAQQSKLPMWLQSNVQCILDGADASEGDLSAACCFAILLMCAWACPSTEVGWTYFDDMCCKVCFKSRCISVRLPMLDPVLLWGGKCGFHIRHENKDKNDLHFLCLVFSWASSSRLFLKG